MAVLRPLSASFGQSHFINGFFQEFLYLLEVEDIVFADKGDGYAVAVGTRSAAYAVDIVFRVVGHVIVDDQCYVVDVNATCYDVCSYKHVYLSALELEHHLVAFGLLKVGVHLAAIDVLALQGACHLLHFHFAAAEDDDALQVASLEDVLDDVHLLRFVAYVCFLLYFLCRFAHGQFYLYGVLEQCFGQLFYFVGHGGGEHNGLARLWQFGSYGFDVF